VDLVSAVLETLRSLDGAAVSFAESIRWEPLTLVFLLASAWWVKWPLIAAIGACGDCACRRRIPRAAGASLLAVGAAALLVGILKQTFDRARPPFVDATLDPIGAVPASASFPSGHAATAFAAAVAIGLVHPRLRRPLLAMAAVVALSRVYLGVHYVLDVLAGSVLGAAVGVAAARLVAMVAPAPRAHALRPAPVGTSSAPPRRLPE
jgi:undecaprenyl-diphosphatase